MSTTIRLTAQSEKLLKEQLAASPDSSPEEIIERALETFAQRQAENNGSNERKMTPAEALDAILELRKTQTLGGITIRDLINEGRKY